MKEYIPKEYLQDYANAHGEVVDWAEAEIVTKADIRAEVLEKLIEFANTKPTVEPDDGEIRPMILEEMATHVLAEMEQGE